MSTRLVILGLLREQPLHGYEIKHIIEEHMGDWTSIAFGSIYFALGKLSEEGLIKMVATEKTGNRPSRSIYQITEAGRAEFLRLLREVWNEPERQYFAIDVGLAFMNALPAEEIKGYLQKPRGTIGRGAALSEVAPAGTNGAAGCPCQRKWRFSHIQGRMPRRNWPGRKMF